MAQTVKTRRINQRSLVLALSGAEKKYPVYRFGKGKKFYQKQGHNTAGS